MTLTTKNTSKSKLKKKELIPLIIMITVTAVTLYPFFLMLTVSVKSSKEALLNPAGIPSSLHFENFAEVWNIMNYPQVFGNTLFITVGGLFGIIVISGLASYMIALSEHKKLFNFLYVLFLCGVMIPFYTTLISLVKLMSTLHIDDSRIGMILYYWGRNIPMAVFLYTGFIRGVSVEVLNAAKVDGANHWQVFWKVLFPMLKPITTTIIVLDAMTLWNDFLMPKLMLVTTSKRTISLSQYFFTGEFGSKYQLVFASYLMAMLPVLILYFFLQKNIIKGVAAGAVKG